MHLGNTPFMRWKWVGNHFCLMGARKYCSESFPVISVSILRFTAVSEYISAFPVLPAAEIRGLILNLRGETLRNLPRSFVYSDCKAENFNNSHQFNWLPLVITC